MLFRVAAAIFAVFAALFALGWIVPERPEWAVACLAVSVFAFLLSTMPTGRVP